MLSDKLNAPVNKQIEDSKGFWADKPKMTEAEKQAASEFSGRTGIALEKAMASVNVDFNAMTQEAINKYTKETDAGIEEGLGLTDEEIEEWNKKLSATINDKENKENY